MLYTSVQTGVGPIHIAFSDQGPQLIATGATRLFLAKAQTCLGGRPTYVRDPRNPFIQMTLYAVDTGQLYNGPLPPLRHLTTFAQKVLEATRHIPRGQVLTYSELAGMIGAPRAQRAVGNALAQNPLPFIVPCHRVIRADGHLGGYSGGGRNTKARLLGFEGVNVAAMGRVRA